MSLLTILKFPNQKLREKSKPVGEVGSSIRSLVKNMFETMVAENGIGLAAPQVGETIRVIVADVPRLDPAHPEEKLSDPIALVNPEIITGEGLIRFEEGCLSCPELAILVDRFEKIKVGFWNLEGKPQTLDAEGLKAVCIQHEIDHLDGILLVDKLSRLKRDLYKQKRLRILKEERELATIL